MICKESPENAVAGWGERNKQKHSAKRKEKESFLFCRHQRSHFHNGRNGSICHHSTTAPLAQQHPPYDLMSLSSYSRLLPLPISSCVFFFTPLDAARIISPGLAHHFFPFCVSIAPTLPTFLFVYIPCTTSTFTGIDSTLTCC